MACWLDSWLDWFGSVMGSAAMGSAVNHRSIPFHHNMVENPKFLLQVVKGICVFVHLITRVKSNVFFRTIFGALFFKSIIDLGISMSDHLFLRRIFWKLVCLRVATGLTVN